MNKSQPLSGAETGNKAAHTTPCACSLGSWHHLKMLLSDILSISTLTFPGTPIPGSVSRKYSASEPWYKAIFFYFISKNVYCAVYDISGPTSTFAIHVCQ